MKFYRIDITAWTTSFRYPNLISGFQPTLKVPPISTVLGLINAAAGKFLSFQNEQLGYFFEYEMEGTDLETIYQMAGKGNTTSNNAKSNVMRREFLFNPHLVIYTSNQDIAQYFKKPVYPILLGRMNDLATINEISEIEMKSQMNSEIKGQLVPSFPYQLAGQIQALPEYFSNTFPRQNLGTKPFTVVSCKNEVKVSNLETFRDSKLDVNIFMHQLSFDDE